MLFGIPVWQEIWGIQLANLIAEYALQGCAAQNYHAFERESRIVL